MGSTFFRRGEESATARQGYPEKIGRRKWWRRYRLLIAAAPLLFGRHAAASTDKWTSINTNWSSNTGWSLSHPPGNLDTVSVAGSSGNTDTLTFDAAATATNLGTLWIDAPNLTTRVTLSQVASSLTTNLEIIGFTNAGALSLSGGTMTVGGSGSNGLYIGWSLSSTGSANISGGTLNIPNSFLCVGNLGSGTITQSAGTVLLGGSGTNGLVLGNEGNGVYTMTGGTLSVLNGAITLGANNGVNGTFNQFGGSNSAGTLDIGAIGNSSYSLSNTATLIVIQNATVGDVANAVFTQYGGIASIGANLQIGNVFGANGSFTQGGGLLSVMQGTTTIGVAGSGTMALSGGTHQTLSLVLGQSAGANGVYQLSATGNLFVSGDAQIGLAGSGTFSQIGGAASVSGNLLLGAQVGGFGSASFSGGTISAAGLFIGGSSNATGGTGNVSVSGGNLLVTGPLKIYSNNAANALSLSAGNVSAGSLDLGGNPSALSWTGGTLQITGTNGITIDATSAAGGNWSIANGQSLIVNYSEIVGSSTSGGSITQTGGSHSVTGNLTIASGVGSTGTYTLGGGTLSAPVIDNGTFNQTGGTFTGSLNVAGNFTFSGGTFNGPLSVGVGANANFTAPFQTTSAISLSGNATIAAAISVTADGGLDSEGGAITLSGGTITGSGPLLNNGLITGYGAITGAGGFTNGGTITQSSGNLTFANTGSSINNSTINLATGRQLILNTNFSNAATISLNGAMISGSATLNNTPSGSLSGPGTIAVPLINTGSIAINSGVLSVSNVFTNSGNIQLGGLTASMNGAGIINANQISGIGTVNAPVTNNATIQALGGTLTFTAPLTNSSTGLLEASTGAKLLLSGGIASNAGQIGLDGGIVDTGTQTLSNYGLISGFGILSTAGLTNAAGATITLAGGTSSIYGTLTNAPGATVRVSSSTAIFQGPVINNGFMQVTTANVTFAGGLTENGIYSSDPSVHVISNLSIGKQGALVSSGDTFLISGNFLSSSTASATWNTRDSVLEFAGVTTHVLSITGSDNGNTSAGGTNNFAWQELRVDDNGVLTLRDGNADPGGALYVDTLDLIGAPSAAGLSAYIADHLANANAADSMNIYYDPAAPADAYLADQIYALGNGGFLAPVGVPEPALLMPIAAFAAACLARRRRRIPHFATNSPD